MSTYPRPRDLSIAPEGSELRFAVYKVHENWWVVQGNQEDEDGDNWWSNWPTQAEAFAAAIAYLKKENS